MNAKKSRGGTRLISSRKRVVLIILLVLLSILIVKGVGVLKKKQLEYESKSALISDLQEAAESEESKAKQNASLDNQAITDEEYESLAREELGLIKKDEIVIKPR